MSTVGNIKGACDRCRGQKLRCVGHGKPISNPRSRFQRNEIPCERCRRAKVDCYSKIPESTRTAPPLSPSTGKHGVARPRSSPSSSRSVRHISNTLRSQQSSEPADNSWSDYVTCSDASHMHDINNTNLTDPITSQELLANTRSETVENWDLFDLQTPPWMLGHNSATESVGEHNKFNREENIISAFWSNDHNGIDQDPEAPIVMHSAPMPLCSTSGSKSRPMSTQQRPVQDVESIKSCIKKLARLNEELLCERSGMQDVSVETETSSIGQILGHCEKFITILQCLSQSHYNSDTYAKRSEADLSRIGDHPRTPSLRNASVLSSSAMSPLTPCAMTAPSLDVPVLLSVLTCYAHILQSFESLFAPILRDMTGPVQLIPTLLPGLSLDGFALENHNALQLECLASVSLHVLGRIEDILIGTSRHGGLFNQVRGGLCYDKLLSGLLESLYEPSGQDGSHHRAGTQELKSKRLIREVQAALRHVEM